MQYKIQFSCISHTGYVRSTNQDNMICDGRYRELTGEPLSFPLSGEIYPKEPALFGVFDGMGGEECGDVAAYLAAKEAATIPKKGGGVTVLSTFCARANHLICAYAANHAIAAMGTTAAMLLFTHKKIVLCNIGDSRIFRLSDSGLVQISKDHVASAAFGRKPPLSQNLGIPPEQLLIEPYLATGRCRIGDRYLICSDGLTDMVTEQEIILLLQQPSPEEAASALVSKALENGGKDNVTVLVLEVRQKENRLFKK